MTSSSRWKPREGTTWLDKLTHEHPNHGTIVRASASQRRKGIESVLISRPLDVDAMIKRVRKGRLITVTQIRDKLALDAGTDTTCPLTTGIFLRIVAEAAEESARSGRKRITPWWRVIDSNGGLKRQFPGGISRHARELRNEGHIISQAKGKQAPRVQDFESRLVVLESL
ncbi:MAG: hypothetical protein ACF8GE_06175 [Phycisphaerales bacterium JB043]